MPIFKEGQDPLAAAGGDLQMPMVRGDSAAVDLNPPLPTEVVGAAFRQSNPIVSVMAAINEASPDKREDPNHNPFALIAGTPYADDPGQFVGSRNEAETRAIMASMDRQRRDRETIAASGAAGQVYGLFAGILDPLVFAPMGGAAKVARGGYSIAKSAATVGGLSGLYAGVSEGVLQMSQSTRPNDDIGLVVGSATLLGGLIGGGAASLLNRAERQAVTAALDADRAAMGSGLDASMYSPPRPGNAGAAAVDVRTMQPKPLLPDWAASMVPPSVRDKANDWLMGLSPTQRTFFARDSIEARKGVAELVELAFEMEDNVKGITTTRDGLPPVSRQVMMIRTAATVDAADALEANFLGYRYGQGGSLLRAAAEDMTGRTPAGKMSFADFKIEVSKALRNGDQHAIEEVQAVAQSLRRTIFDPLAQRLVDAGLLKSDEIAPRGDKSFLSRMWNKEVIAARRLEFREVITKWLQDEQTAKSAAKSRIQSSADKRAVARKQLSRIDGRLKTLEKRMAEAAIRMDERVQEVVAGQKRGDLLADRADILRSSISDLEEFITAMKAEANDPELLARLADMEDELTALKAEERASAVTPADLGRIEAQEIRDTLHGDMRKAAEVLVGRRNLPKDETFISWLVRNGGVGDAEAKEILKDINRPGLKRASKDSLPRLDVYNQKFSLKAIGEKLYEDFRHAFSEPPSEEVVSDLLSDVASGREPWFMMFDRDGMTQAGRISAMVDYLSEVFERADLPVPKSVRDIPRVLNADTSRSIDDVMREDAEMAAAGAAIPPGMRREAHEAIMAAEQDARQYLLMLADKARREAGVKTTTERVVRNWQAEAGIAVNRSAGRLRLLSRRQDQIETMTDLLDTARRNAEKLHDDLTDTIEKELRAWQGDSAADALAALKERDKAELARQAAIQSGTYKGRGERIAGADGAVNRAVRRILKSDRDMDATTLTDRADEIINRILGSPDGRLPYDAPSGGVRIGPPTGKPPERGSLHARDFAIPTALVEDFVENDIEHVLQSYLRTIVPDLLLHERFGDVEMKAEFRAIDIEYEGKIAAAKTEKQRIKLEADRQGAIRDMAALRDRVRNVYGFPQSQAMPITSRVAAAAKNYNVITDLGGSVVSSIADLAGAQFRHGFSTVFRTAWLPFSRGLMSLQRDAFSVAAIGQVKAMNLSLETSLNLRTHQFNDVLENYRPGSKIERGLSWAADKFQLANFQAPWTDIVKTMAGTTSTDAHLAAIDRLVNGKATVVDINMLAQGNINEATARAIHAQVTSGGGSIIDGVRLADIDQWTDARAREALVAAVARDVDMMVVTPGPEKPLWMSNPVFSLLGQFKSFVAATHERIMIPALQRRDATTVAGLFTGVGAGMMSYKLYSLLTGKETSDRPQDWIKEGISRSGTLGWYDEVNNAFLAKISSGKLDMYRLVGADRPMSKFQQRSTMAGLLGPTWGKVEGFSAGTSAAFSGQWTQADTTRMRRLMPLQNLVYMRNLLNQAEAGINDAFGVPMKAQ